MNAAMAFLALGLLAIPGTRAIAGDAATVDLSGTSAGFWNDMKTVEQTDQWKTLVGSVGLVGKSKAAVAAAIKNRKQAVMNVSLGSAANTADFVNKSAAAAAALDAYPVLGETLKMRASPKMVEAAQPMVAPAVQPQIQHWRADLTNGIQGLPGIYLGANAESNAGIPPAESPEGYQPVSSGSIGCMDQ